MPTGNFLEFIIYIAPGFLAQQLYRAKYPAKPMGTFSHVIWSLIYGIIILIGIGSADKYIFCDFLNATNTAITNHRFIGALLIGGVILGSIVIFLHWLRFKLSVKYKMFNWIAPDPQSIWVKINQPYDTEQWAIVYLKDGSIYYGWISEYRFDPAEQNQDFLLTKAARLDDFLNIDYEVKGMGVYLNTRDVVRIEFVESRKPNNQEENTF